MAPQVAAVAAALVFSLVDFLVSSMLFSKGFSLAVFVSSCATFNPARSALDLWLWAWLRGALLVGVALGVARNRRAGPGRASSSATAVVFVAMVIATYAVAKALVLSEEKSLLQQPWELSLIVWSCVASVALALIWRQLGNTQDGPPLVFSDDREQLLDPCQDQDQDQSGSKVQDQDQSGSKVQDQDQSNSGATLGRLLCYCRKDFCLLSLATAFLLISAVCEAFIPLFYGLAIDHIVQQQSLDQPVLKLAALALSSSIAMGVRGGVFTLIFARLNLRLRNHLFTSFMRQEIGFYDHNHTGDLLSRLAADTTQVSDLVSQNVNILLRSLVKAVGFCIFMFSISCKLTVLTLLGLPFIGLVSEVYGDYYKRLTKAVQSTLAEANRVAEETLSSMRTVRSFANEREEAESYYGKLLLMFDLNKKQALAYAAYMWCSSFSEVALEVSVLYYGGHLVVSGQISSGALISFFIYMLQLGECLESVSSVYSGLMSGVGAAEKVFEFLDREPQGPGPDPGPGLEEPETCSGLVEFRDVHFSYPSRPETEVLKGVSFSLQPGHVTALVGPSGGGKSSCVSLLENFYVPQSGQVLLDGRPVQTLTHHFLHSQVALVSQEPVLFARSVEENICYGLKDPAEGAVERAARQANAHDFICDLHQGYKTSVGEKGAQLSGGQKQRVAIARALVRDPRVLILDEATSALDAHSEHLVQKALQAAMGNRTVLVVAHRLSSVENADRIVVIHQGGVAEQGTHHELMQRRGLYRRLVQRQLRDPDPDPDLDQDCRADLGPQGGGARSQGGGARTRSHSSEEEEADFRPRF